MSETKHQMKLRHKQELKALEASAGKGIGAKKALKEAEKLLLAKHEEQLKNIDKKPQAAPSHEAVEVKQADASDSPAPNSDSSASSSSSAAAAAASASSAVPASFYSTSSAAPSRASKKRAAKLAKEKERDEFNRELTKDMVDMKSNESNAISSLLAPHNLVVRSIVSDGHCLYRALHDQLLVNELEQSLKDAHARCPHASLHNNNNNNVPDYMLVRHVCHHHMQRNPDVFMPFLQNDDGECLNKQEFDQYLAEMIDQQKAVWGGHPEIVAFSNALHLPVNVWNADGKIQVGTDDAAAAQQPTIQLSWHRHYYGLGDHFNSVVVQVPEEQSDDDDD